MSGESFTAKLRRLRREVAARTEGTRAEGARTDAAPTSEHPAPGRGAPTRELPAHLRARLDRSRSDLAARATDGPPRDLAPVGRAWQRVARFYPDHRHGAHALDEAVAACTATVALLARDEALRELDPARAVYLDIEATGLSGGSGTYPYLVALLSRRDDHWELWQGFMAAPDEERDLLAEVARRVRAAEQMVTFFGKSFDRHRLEDKMRHHRVAPPFADCLHLDLYHPLKRLYDGAERDGKLQTHERALLGLEREDDLPGAFAPMAWFDFVGGRPHLLEEVFRHNATDVLSLAALTAHLGRALGDDARLAGSAAHRARGLGRTLAASKRHAEAADWLERAAARFERRGAASEAARLRLEAARELERAGEREAARERHAELAARADDLVAALALERAALIDARAGRRDAALEGIRAACERLRRVPVGRERDAASERLVARLARYGA